MMRSIVLQCPSHHHYSFLSKPTKNLAYINGTGTVYHARQVPQLKSDNISKFSSSLFLALLALGRRIDNHSVIFAILG